MNRYKQFNINLMPNVCNFKWIAMAPPSKVNKVFFYSNQWRPKNVDPGFFLATLRRSRILSYLTVLGVQAVPREISNQITREAIILKSDVW